MNVKEFTAWVEAINKIRDKSLVRYIIKTALTPENIKAAVEGAMKAREGEL